MGSEKKKRYLWKTFYIESGRDYHELESIWQSWSRSQKKHKMFFDDGDESEPNGIQHVSDDYEIIVEGRCLGV